MSTSRVVNLRTVAGRNRLPVKPDPYWEKLVGTLYVGYRKTGTGAGTWSARTLNAAKQRVFVTFGALEASGGEPFAEAKRLAEAWNIEVQTGRSNRKATVADVCREYVEAVRTGLGLLPKADGSLHQPRPDTADEAEGRFKRHVYDTPLAGVEFGRVAEAHFEAWRAGLRSKRGEPMTASSRRRVFIGLKAALNYGATRYTTNGTPWAKTLATSSKDDTARNLLLTADDVADLLRLTQLMQPDLLPMLKLMCHLPVRPGTLARATRANFDPRSGKLVGLVDKTGVRDVALGTEALAIVTEAAANKMPNAPLFARADGSHWTANAWQPVFRKIVEAAGLPDETVVYSLRHRTITEMLNAGVRIGVVAKLAGTSPAMIAKTYDQIQSQQAVQAQDALAVINF